MVATGRLTAGMTVLLALLVLAPPVGWGHARLVKSVPSRGAQLTRPPARVQLWFNERLESAFSHLSVSDRQGTRVDLKDVAVPADDPRQLSVSVPPLEPGTYVVKFRVLSVDGHVVEGDVPFTVRGRR